MSQGAYRTADATVAARNAAAVTLHDTDLIQVTRALYIGGAGNLKVTMIEGGVVTFTGLATGQILPIQAVTCWSTGSTASLVLALY